MLEKLYAWQKECLQCWISNGGRGIVNVVTGAGKTFLALAAIEELKKLWPDLKVYIIVPKVFLAAQWARALREELNISHADIGYYSGSRKDSPLRAFMIYVINSARYSAARHIVTDFESRKPVFLIADECHHYGTSENARIFGFMEYIPNDGMYYSLGLSATPYTPYLKTVLIPALGEEIYLYGFGNALQEGIINPFTVYDIALRFRPDERREYDDYTEKLRHALRELKSKYPLLRGMGGSSFFARLRNLASSEGETAEMARGVQWLMFLRKDVIYRARERLSCVISLVDCIQSSAKIIIFTERIETTEIIFEILKNRVSGGLGLYHSKMAAAARSTVIRRFEDGEIRVLVSCKALDEGLNVPETDVGILVSSTNSDRQRIQRMGRVLRKKGSAESRLYYLYIENSAEEMTLLPALSAIGIPSVDISYSRGSGFVYPYYDELAAEAVAYVRNKNWDDEKIKEVEKNIEFGRISNEWLLSETECRERIAAAKKKTEKNYFVTMLLLAKARERN